MCELQQGELLLPVNTVLTLYHSRSLFPDEPNLAHDLFRVSGVSDTFRAQQLSLRDFQQLYNACVPGK